MVKFSIVVPAYNVVDYIDDAIRCIINQSYSNFECFIVDDGSTDGTSFTAETYEKLDKRIKCIHHGINKGVSAARNTGIGAASGDYILFLDPDDTYEHNLLEKVAVEIEKNSPDVVIYGHNEDYRNSDGTLQYSKRINITDEDVFFDNRSYVPYYEMQLEQATMLGYVWNKAYRLALVRDNNVKYKDIRHIEDFLFNVDVMEHVKSISTLSASLYHYRNQGQVRLTGGVVEDYFSLQKLRVSTLLEQQRKFGSLDDYALGVLASVYFRSFMSMMVRDIENDVDKKTIIEKAKSECVSRNQLDNVNLWEDLKEHLPEDNKKLRILYKPLAKGKMKRAYRRAKILVIVRQKMPGVFNRAKQVR